MDIRKKTWHRKKCAVQLLSDIWKARDITNTTEVFLMKNFVWSIVTYRCEGWTLKKADH